MKGSGEPIGLSVTGADADDFSVLVLAWSDAEFRMMDEWAFALRESPWELDASKLDELPEGKCFIQVYGRLNGRLSSPKDELAIEILPADGADGGDGNSSGGGDYVDPDDLDPSQHPTLRLIREGEVATNTRGYYVTRRDADVAIANGRLIEEPGTDPEFSVDDTSTLSHVKAEAVYLLLGGMLADAGNSGETPTPDPDLPDISVPSNPLPDYQPSADTRIIYVSSSKGSDTNDGLSPDKPVKTASRGLSLVRNGVDDWVLFKRGDTFEGGLGFWTLSGKSADRPMIIGTYGAGDRPLFKANGGSIIFNWGGGISQHVVFNGLDFYANTRDPSSPDYKGGEGSASGIRWLAKAKDIRFEDVKISFFQVNVVFEARNAPHETTDISFKRCIITDAYPGRAKNGHVAHSQGAFFFAIADLTIEDSVFLNNGWNVKAQKDGVGKPTMFNHNMYVNQCHGAVIRNNLVALGSSYGIKIAADKADGGSKGIVIENNLLVENVNAITVGGNNQSNYPYSHRDVTVTGNVVARGGSDRLGPVQSFGFSFSTVDGGSVSQNLFLDKSIEGPTHCAYAKLGPFRNFSVRNNAAMGWNKASFVASSQVSTSNNEISDSSPSAAWTMDKIKQAAEREVGKWDAALTAPTINDQIRQQVGF